MLEYFQRNPFASMKCSALLVTFAPALLAFSAQAAFLSPVSLVGDESPTHPPVLAHRSNSVYSVLEAAAAGDIAALEARLAEGENPSQVDEEGNSPLHYAARARSPRALELLLAAGADPAARDARGRTPREVCRHVAFLAPLKAAEEKRERELALSALVARGDEAGVRAALAAGVNPNARSADNESGLLMQAVAAGQVGVARLLLAAGAKVNAATPEGGLTPLHVAASRGDVALIRLLLEAKADPMLQAGNGAYPLHDAIWEKKLEAVRALLPAYAAVNFSPKGGPHGTPLNMAISYGRTAYLRAFLEAGFNPNDPLLKPAPPLILAVRSGQLACVKLLLEAGADKHMKDITGKTAADYAPAELAPLLR